jgi:hypothetical protein
MDSNESSMQRVYAGITRDKSTLYVEQRNDS